MSLLVNELEGMFRPIAVSRQIAFRAELLGALPLVSADRDRLKQTVSNLVANALQHTPAVAPSRYRAEAVGATLEIRVHDTGTGIEPQYIDHVFDRFIASMMHAAAMRAVPAWVLAIAKAIVEAHDGTVVVNSPIGSRQHLCHPPACLNHATGCSFLIESAHHFGRYDNFIKFFGR